MNIFFWRKPLTNRSIKTLLLISGVYMFAYAMFSPIYALFVEKIGGNVTTASNAWAVFMLTAGMLTFATGRLENYLHKNGLLLAISQYVVCLSYVLYYFTKTPIGLYLAMIVLGVGAALFWPAFHAAYSENISSSKSESQWGLYDALAYIVPAFGTFIGGWLVNLYGFGLIFIIMAGLSFVIGTLILCLPKDVI